MATSQLKGVLLDTSVVIDTRNLTEWDDFERMVSAVTVGELHAGEERGDALARAERRHRLLYVRSTHRVLPFGTDEAEAYGVLSSMMRELGRQPRSRALDLQIAATAMVAGLPLLTRNARDLEGLERAVQVVPITG